jgi:predicted dehydrogenase
MLRNTILGYGAAHVRNRLRDAKYRVSGRVRHTDNAVKWGVMGLGSIADQFVRALNTHGSAEVVAVASRDLAKAEKFAKRHRVQKAFGSYLDMISDPQTCIDVVYVSTPVDCHFDNVKTCLELGKNVLCEKPITENSAQFEELTALAKSKSLFLMEGMWMKCLPTYVKGIEWIKQGAIGEVERVRVDLSKCLEGRTALAGSSTAREGVLLDYGVYALAFAVGLMGDPYEIRSALCRKDVDGVDRHWEISLSNGVEAAITISAEIEGDRTAAVTGSRGSVEWGRQFNRTNCIKRFDGSGALVEVYKVKYTNDGLEHEIAEVHRCLADASIESGLVTRAATLSVMRLIDELRSQDDGTAD